MTDLQKKAIKMLLQLCVDRDINDEQFMTLMEAIWEQHQTWYYYPWQTYEWPKTPQTYPLEPYTTTYTTKTTEKAE